MLKSFFHWKVFVNLIVALGIFTGLVWLTFRWLEFHTNHGEEIAVPNVVNMTVQQAIEVLDDQGLEYEVDSFKYDPKFKPYQVLKIYPTPGSHVKDGRTIVLKVNPKTYAPVAVPDILDRYKFLAFRKLDLLGLKVGDTIYEPSIQKDAVIRMMYNGNTVKPGTKVPMFSTLDLVIGSGPMRNVIIPNLVGRTVAEAKAIIAQNYFEVGLVAVSYTHLDVYKRQISKFLIKVYHKNMAISITYCSLLITHTLTESGTNSSYSPLLEIISLTMLLLMNDLPEEVSKNTVSNFLFAKVLLVCAIAFSNSKSAGFLKPLNINCASFFRQ